MQPDQTQPRVRSVEYWKRFLGRGGLKRASSAQQSDRWCEAWLITRTVVNASCCCLRRGSRHIGHVIVHISASKVSMCLTDKPVAVAISDGLKIEAVALNADKSVRPIFIGMDDEAYGGALRPLSKKPLLER